MNGEWSKSKPGLEHQSPHKTTNELIYRQWIYSLCVRFWWILFAALIKQPQQFEVIWIPNEQEKKKKKLQQKWRQIHWMCMSEKYCALLCKGKRQSELRNEGALFIQWSQCRDIFLFVCAPSHTQPMKEESDWTLTQKTSNYHFLYSKQKLVFRICLASGFRNLFAFFPFYFILWLVSFARSFVRFRYQMFLRDDFYGKINV